MAERAIQYPSMEPQRYPGFMPSRYPPPSQQPLNAAMMPVYAVPIPQMNPEANVFGPSAQVFAPPLAATTERLVEVGMPFNFFTRPPRNHPAKFSTEVGTKPFRYLPDDWNAAPIRIVHSDMTVDIRKKIQYLKEKFPPEVLRDVREPPQWSELFLWFDAVEIWTEGAEFLFLVLSSIKKENQHKMQAQSIMEHTAAEWVTNHQLLLLNNQNTKDFVSLFDHLDMGNFIDMTQIEVVQFKDMINRLGREFLKAFIASQRQMQPRATLYDVPEVGQSAATSYPSRSTTYGSLLPASKANEDPRYIYAWRRQRSGTYNAPPQPELASSFQNRPRGFSNDIPRKHQNFGNGQFVGEPTANASSNFQRPEPIYALNPQYRNASEPIQRPYNSRNFSNTLIESNHLVHHQSLPARPPNNNYQVAASQAMSYESNGTVNNLRYPSSENRRIDQYAAQNDHQNRVIFDAKSIVASDSSMVSNRPQFKQSVYPTSRRSGEWYVDSKNKSWELQYNKQKHPNNEVPPTRVFKYVEASEALSGKWDHCDHTVFVANVDEHEHFLNHRLRDAMEQAGDTVQQITFVNRKCVFVNFIEDGASGRALKLWNSSDAPLQGRLTVQERHEKATPYKYHNNDSGWHQESQVRSNYGSPQRGSYSNRERQRKDFNSPRHSRQPSLGQDLQGQSPASIYPHRSSVPELHSLNTGFNNSMPLGRIENHPKYGRPGENPVLRYTTEGLGSPIKSAATNNKNGGNDSPPYKQGFGMGNGAKKENQRPSNHFFEAELGGAPGKRAGKFKGKSSSNSSNQPSPTKTSTKSRMNAEHPESLEHGPRKIKSSEDHATTRPVGSTKNNNKKKKNNSKGNNSNSGLASRNDSHESFTSNMTVETSPSTVFDLSKDSKKTKTDTSFTTNSSRKPSVEDETSTQTGTTPRPNRRKPSTKKDNSSDSQTSSTPTSKTKPGNGQQQAHGKKGSTSSSSARNADNVKTPTPESGKVDKEVVTEVGMASKGDDSQTSIAKQILESPAVSKIDVEDKDAWPSLMPPRSPVTNIADGKRPPPPVVTPLSYKQVGMRGMSGSDKARAGQVPIAIPKMFQSKQ